MKTLKSQRGSILIELVMVCLLLVTITLGVTDIVNLIRADIYLHKVVREGARGASLTGSIEAGRKIAYDSAGQYFVTSLPEITFNEPKTNVVCEADYIYKHFSFLNTNGLGGTDLDAKAIYPWWDENTQ